MKQITRRVLKKMIQEEIEKQRKLKEQNAIAANPGMSYLTPRAFGKKKK